jgi:hypothetical protein
MNIAETIYQQLKETTNESTLLSWGLSALQRVDQTGLESLGVTNGLEGLKFKVNGLIHKGHVLIVLNGLDFYDIYICNIRKNNLNVKEKIENISFCELGNIIDHKVEFCENYQEEIKKVKYSF